MDQEQKNLQSTKTSSDAPPHDTDAYPNAIPEGIPTHACYTVLMEPMGQTTWTWQANLWQHPAMEITTFL